MNKLYLGKVREDFKGSTRGEHIYLSKHSWDCDWYRGFGYIGNKDLHTHFDISFLRYGTAYELSKVFSETKLTQSNWWTILELFQTAYHLKEVAEVYGKGGSCITTNLCKEELQDKELAKRIDQDLKNVLDTVWNYIKDSLRANTGEAND